MTCISKQDDELSFVDKLKQQFALGECERQEIFRKRAEDILKREKILVDAVVVDFRKGHYDTQLLTAAKDGKTYLCLQFETEAEVFKLSELLQNERRLNTEITKPYRYVLKVWGW